VTEPGRRGEHLQRVPPHDDQTEANLLGAVLVQAHIAQLLEPAHFYRDAHATIAQTIVDLAAEGAPTDVGTVAATLRQRGLLDTIGGAAYLIDLQANTPSTTAAPRWAEMLADYYHRRRTLGLASELVDAVYRNTPTGGLVAELHQAASHAALAQHSSWEVANLAAALAGEGDDLEPTVLHRNDQAAVLYAGKVHSIVGEPESGKGWLVLHAAHQIITAGGHVLYVDWEADETTQVTRLLEFGVPPTQILEQFHYIRPTEAHDAAAALRLAACLDAWDLQLIVLDGVAEALALNGWDENNAADVTTFYVQVARPLTRGGAAVVTIDHVVKDKDSQGRYARGSTAKLAAIDGAVLKLEVFKPFGRGLAGAARVVVNKDRHGHVRAMAAGGRNLGEFRLNSTQTAVHALLKAPSTADDAEGGFRPTALMEKVSRAVENANEAGLKPTRNGILAVVRAKRKQDVTDALSHLIEEGHIGFTVGARNSHAHVVQKPYRENEDPRSDRFEPAAADPVSNPEEDF
jgi:hypothetical protein